MTVDSSTTLIVFALGAALTLAATWGDHRRRGKPDGRLGLVPWHGLLFLGVAMMLFMAAHGLTLLRA